MALGVPLAVVPVQAGHAPGESPEDAARKARYRALAEAARSQGAQEIGDIRMGLVAVDFPLDLKRLTVGRVGLKAFFWFVGASLASLTLGLLLVNLFQPGVNSGITLPGAGETSGITTQSLSLMEFITHLIPTSITEAMTKNEILQIVVFSVLFGVACGAVGEKSKVLVDALEGTSYVMLKFTGIVMWFAPFAVFGAVASALARSGPQVLKTYGVFMAEFYVGIIVLWFVLFLAARFVIGRRAAGLFWAVREPTLLAFSTASSEAAYPKTLSALEKFGCSPKVASFVLPLGYSFNLDGSMMYCTFAVMFIAQAMGIHIPWDHQIGMLLLLMVTSKGIAGVPRASLVVISATLPAMGMKSEWIALVLAVDAFMDMGRTATNVIGNSIASAVIAKWEGLLSDPKTDPPVVESVLGDGESAAAATAKS